VGTSSSLAEAAGKVGKILDPSTVQAMLRAGGMAGKKSALEAAAASLGGDRRFSGFKRMGALSAGFDSIGGTSVEIKFRPPGAWKLAESGRKGSKQVRKRGVIFNTPYGPRWSFRSGPSRGLNTITNAHRLAQATVPRAAHGALVTKLGSVF
jgi:hypothetical protein